MSSASCAVIACSKFSHRDFDDCMTTLYHDAVEKKPSVMRHKEHFVMQCTTQSLRPDFVAFNLQYRTTGMHCAIKAARTMPTSAAVCNSSASRYRIAQHMRQGSRQGWVHLHVCQHALQSDIVFSKLVQGMNMLKLEPLDLLYSSLILCLQCRSTCSATAFYWP